MKKRGPDVHDVTEMPVAKEIERICDIRNDEWSEKVRFRIKSVHHDLPAADAVYHQTCSTNFRTCRQIPIAFQTDECTPNKRSRGRSLNATQVSAFLEVAQYLQDNDDEQITVIDLIEKMKERCGTLAYSAVHMKNKLENHFGDSIIITEINGKQNVVTFRTNASAILQAFYERPKTSDPSEEQKEIIKTAGRLILNDIKSLDAPKNIIQILQISCQLTTI